jgi:hypothetical protein
MEDDRGRNVRRIAALPSRREADFLAMARL